MSETFFIDISGQSTDIADLKVTQLKAELKKRAISTTGNKQELYEKLKNFLKQQQNNSPSNVLNSSLTTPVHLKNTRLNKSIDSPQQLNLTFLHDQNLQNDSVIDDKTEIEVNQSKVKTVESTNVESVNVESVNVESVNVESSNDESVNVESVNVESSNDESVNVESVNAEVITAEITIPEISNIQSIHAETLPIPQNPEISDTQDIPIENETKSAEATNIIFATTDFIPDKLEKAESDNNDVPMSGDRNRFSRSKSPKARWHTVEEANESEKSIEDLSNQTVESDQNIQMEIESETQPNKLNKSNENIDDTSDVNKNKVQRKRKWLNNDAATLLSSKKQLTISSDTLKSYLPTPIAESLLSKKDEELTKTDDKSESTVEKNMTSNGRKVIEQTKSQENSLFENSKTLNRQYTRTVIIDESNEDSAVDKTSDRSKLPEKIILNNRQTIEDTTKSENSIPLNPVSEVLHISNLTRPFTLHQFKELLTKYGALKKIEQSYSPKNEHYFWINSVKSHCYAAFEHESSATKAREGLHNITWPQSNPKHLQVDFSNMDELLMHMKSDNSFIVPITIQNLPKQETVTMRDEEIQIKKTEIVKKESIDSSNLNEQESDKTNTKIVREWDLPKYASDSRNNVTRLKDIKKKNDESNVKQTESKKSRVEEPHKTLDDLFKKTTSAPHIYWLPLSEEQFIKRQKEAEKRIMERLKRAEERSLKMTELRIAEESKKKELHNSVEVDEKDEKLKEIKNSSPVRDDLNGKEIIDSKKERDTKENESKGRDIIRKDDIRNISNNKSFRSNESYNRNYDRDRYDSRAKPQSRNNISPHSTQRKRSRNSPISTSNRNSGSDSDSSSSSSSRSRSRPKNGNSKKNEIKK